jgi:short chain dehydrogenase
MTQQPAGQRHWTEADVPDLSGRTAVITGASAGLGLQTARVLAAHGAQVVLACRNLDKAGLAVGQIAAGSAGTSASVVRLDLASQASVGSAAEEIRARFEGGRIVTVSSVAHRSGVIDFDDLQTDLFANESRAQQFLLSPPMRIINFWAVQNARMGALPTLRAATDPSAQGGQYFGPRRYGLRRWFYTGYPAAVESSARSRDQADQARLWQLSERLTGVSYAALS